MNAFATGEAIHSCNSTRTDPYTEIRTAAAYLALQEVTGSGCVAAKGVTWSLGGSGLHLRNCACARPTWKIPSRQIRSHALRSSVCWPRSAVVGASSTTVSAPRFYTMGSGSTCMAALMMGAEARDADL